MGDIFRWLGLTGRLNPWLKFDNAPRLFLARRSSPLSLPALLMAFMLAGFAAGAMVVIVVMVAGGGNQEPAAEAELVSPSTGLAAGADFPVPGSGGLPNSLGQPLWTQPRERGGFQQIGRKDVRGDTVPGWGQEGQLSGADSEAVAKTLEEILGALEGLVSAQGDRTSSLDQHAADLDQLRLLLKTFQADPPTLRTIRGIEAMWEELEEVRWILKSYATDKQIESLNWPVETHPSWDAIDDLHGKIDWVHEMLDLLVKNNQIILDPRGPDPTNTPEPPDSECPGFVKSFPDAWGCGASFVFQGDGGVIQSELESTACARSGLFGHRLFYSNSGPGFSGWGIQWNGSPQGRFNAFASSKLVFWVKGDVGGETFQVGLKDTASVEKKVELSSYLTVTKDWQQIIIPLDDFVGVNKGSVANWNLGFNNTHGHGVICIDDARFTN